MPKISGNVATDVLKDLAAREMNNDRTKAIKKLNKEISGYVNKIQSSDISQEL